MLEKSVPNFLIFYICWLISNVLYNYFAFIQENTIFFVNTECWNRYLLQLVAEREIHQQTVVRENSPLEAAVGLISG